MQKTCTDHLRHHHHQHHCDSLQDTSSTIQTILRHIHCQHGAACSSQATASCQGTWLKGHLHPLNQGLVRLAAVQSSPGHIPGQLAVAGSQAACRARTVDAPALQGQTDFFPTGCQLHKASNQPSWKLFITRATQHATVAAQVDTEGSFHLNRMVLPAQPRFIDPCCPCCRLLPV